MAPNGKCSNVRRGAQRSPTCGYARFFLERLARNAVSDEETPSTQIRANSFLGRNACMGSREVEG